MMTGCPQSTTSSSTATPAPATSSGVPWWRRPTPSRCRWWAGGRGAGGRLLAAAPAASAPCSERRGALLSHTALSEPENPGRGGGRPGLTVWYLVSRSQNQPTQRGMVSPCSTWEGRASTHIRVAGFFPQIQAAKPSLAAWLGCGISEPGLVVEGGPSLPIGLPFVHSSISLPVCPSILSPPTPPPALCRALGPQHGPEQGFAELWRALGQSDLLRPLQGRGRPGAGGPVGSEPSPQALWEPLPGSASQAHLLLSFDCVCVCVCM